MRLLNSVLAFVSEWMKPLPEVKKYKELCLNCKKECDFNYCDWNCHVESAEKAGGQVYTPNKLPIRCIKADGTMLEHEHGDHPDYKFPVVVKFIGKREGDDYADDFEEHALIYTDGCVAITLYEYCYAMWYLGNGELAAGRLWNKGDWKLEELEKIRDLNKSKETKK